MTEQSKRPVIHTLDADSGLTPTWLGQPAALRMRRTEVRPIPSRRAISEWLSRSALSRST